MDIKIDFMHFDRDILKVELPDIPGKVFIDFDNIEGITQPEFRNLIDIYDKFPKSSLFFVNISNNLQEQLKFLLNRDEKIRIIPNEVKRDKRTSNE